MYAPPVDYAAIGRARASVRMPVVANGDIISLERFQTCAHESGCTAFMIGRGALARPYLFRELRGDGSPHLHGVAATCDVLLRYERLMHDGGFTPEARLRRLKQWLGLSVPFAPVLQTLFSLLKVETDLTRAQLLFDRTIACAA
jgi:tRNA-dihydrouridine synthase C